MSRLPDKSAWIASLLGEEPSRQINEDLRRLKQQFEAGEVATSARARRDRAMGDTTPSEGAPFSFKAIRQGAS